jgi:hypothetical protein
MGPLTFMLLSEIYSEISAIPIIRGKNNSYNPCNRYNPW